MTRISELPIAVSEQSEIGADDVVLAQLTGSPSLAPGILIDRRQQDCRRSRSMASLIRGNTKPRRRLSRRAGDHNSLLLDWYPPKMLYLALGILLLSCADALFTLNLLALGAEEVNVLMLALLESSVDLFVGVKITLTAISVVILVVLAQQRFMGWFRVIRVMQAACIGYVVLIAYEIYLLRMIMIW